MCNNFCRQIVLYWLCHDLIYPQNPSKQPWTLTNMYILSYLLHKFLMLCYSFISVQIFQHQFAGWKIWLIGPSEVFNDFVFSSQFCKKSLIRKSLWKFCIWSKLNPFVTRYFYQISLIECQCVHNTMYTKYVLFHSAFRFFFITEEDLCASYYFLMVPLF